MKNYEQKQALLAILPIIQKFPITITKKAFHQPEYFELAKIWQQLFNINYSYDIKNDPAMVQYREDLKTNKSKKKLDFDLNYCKESLINQVERHIEWLETA